MVHRQTHLLLGKKNFNYKVILISSNRLITPYWVQLTSQSVCLFVFGTTAPRVTGPLHSWGFLDHTQRRTTFSRTPLGEWSARRRDRYPTKHDTHKKQTFMPPVGFEPAISTGERPQIYALDRSATGTGNFTVSNRWLVVTYVPPVCFDFYHFIIRETLQRHSNAEISVKDVRAKI